MQPMTCTCALAATGSALLLKTGFKEASSKARTALQHVGEWRPLVTSFVYAKKY